MWKRFSSIKTRTLIWRQHWVSLKYQGHRTDARFLPKSFNQVLQQQSSRDHTDSGTSHFAKEAAYFLPWVDTGPTEPWRTALVQTTDESGFLSLGTWQCSKLSLIEDEMLCVLVPGMNRYSWSLTQITLLYLTNDPLMRLREWGIWPTLPHSEVLPWINASFVAFKLCILLHLVNPKTLSGNRVM